MPVRNIIFDLGGVLINLDYHATSAAFKNLGMQHFDDIFSQATQSGLFDLLDKGRISPQVFRDEMRKHLPPGTTDTEIDTAWNAMLLDLPQYRIEFLKKTAQQFRIFLLSNTNEIHIPEFEKRIREENHIENFSSLFEGAYYSSRIGMRKPDEEIFNFVVERHDLNKDETLFIDDSIQHVVGACNAGIHAIHLDVKNGEDVVNLIF